MTWYTYDTEVFARDYIVVFKDIGTGESFVFHNDNEGVRDFIRDDAVYCGFNTKHYDQYIMKAIAAGFSPEEVKAVNDYIIGGGVGWECPLLEGVYYRFNNIDIRDDVQPGLSLKAIEGHLGMSVEESEVDFDLDRPLTSKEIERTVTYCKYDVDAAEKLTEIRRDYLATKQNLGKRAGIDPVQALSATNAKLTAMMLKAVRKEWTDGRQYVYPQNVDKSLIPQEVLDFFNTIYDESIPDEELFETSQETVIGDMPCKFGWGGVHGSVKGYYAEATETRVIQNRDVSSLYPSLIEEYSYLSRNVPDPQLFYDIRKDRIRAKHRGDKQTASDLKLPLNTVSGAQENRYNDLYDPLPTRSLRISGQLFLTMLAVALLKSCKTIKLLNLNTDGIMYEVDKEELPIVDMIAVEWEETTRLELETDDIAKVWIKDVSNLLIIKTDGTVKTVGSYLNYGISVKGAWAINNNMTIVKKALAEYFVKGIPPEEIILACDDIFEFQIIAKAGAKYREAYHMVDGEKRPVQKVNRVYATADKRYGKLYKVKREDDSTAKIEMLPEHCIIDNDNHLTIEDIDKDFYITVARKRINDFMGIKPEKKRRTKTMPNSTTKKPTNIYQKLFDARHAFAETGVTKSGRNIQLSSKFFELEDIIPPANGIFKELRLLPLVNFTAEKVTMTLLDVDDPEQRITFEVQTVLYDGNRSVTPTQAYGAVITYYRRYLYMIALDICERDGLENNLTPLPTDVTPEAVPAPSLTDGSGNADALQIDQLKELLAKLLEKDPSKEEMIMKIAIDTRQFTVISKADCEQLIIEISKMLQEVK